MEFASYGTLIDFSDKTQTFSLNSNVIKNPEYVRIIDKNVNGEGKSKDQGSDNKEKKNEFYTEEYLKKFIKQVSEALEYRIFVSIDLLFTIKFN